MATIHLFSDYDCCCGSGTSTTVAAFTSKAKADKFEEENKSKYYIREEVELDAEDE